MHLDLLLYICKYLNNNDWLNLQLSSKYSKINNRTIIDTKRGIIILPTKLKIERFYINLFSTIYFPNNYNNVLFIYNNKYTELLPTNIINGPLKIIFASEAPYVSSHSLPFGSSLLAVAMR